MPIDLGKVTRTLRPETHSFTSQKPSKNARRLSAETLIESWNLFCKSTLPCQTRRSNTFMALWMRPLWKQTVKRDDPCWGFHLCTSKPVKDAIPPTPAFLPVPSKKPGRQHSSIHKSKRPNKVCSPPFNHEVCEKSLWKICLVSFCFFGCVFLENFRGRNTFTKKNTKNTHQKHHIGRLRKRPPGCRSTAKCLLREAHTTRYKIDLGNLVEKSPQKHGCGTVFSGGEVGSVW